ASVEPLRPMQQVAACGTNALLPPLKGRLKKASCTVSSHGLAGRRKEIDGAGYRLAASVLRPGRVAAAASQAGHVSLPRRRQDSKSSTMAGDCLLERGAAAAHARSGRDYGRAVRKQWLGR